MIVFLFNLGGVPVFNLPTDKFSFLSFLASFSLEGSPILPPGDCSSPVCITPPKNVPVVKTTLLVKISSPDSVITDLILRLSISRSITESSFIVKFFVDTINSCIASLYRSLSVWTLVALTAWPFVEFKTR